MGAHPKFEVRIVAKETVLVTATGTIVAQGIIKSLKLANQRHDKVAYRIIGADMSPGAAGLYRCDEGVLVPGAGDQGYVDAIVRVCKEERVRGIFVGAEEELGPLAKESGRIEKESGAAVIADARAIAIGRDKWKTFEFLRDNDLPTAESALPEQADEFTKKVGFPVIVKPREGHGSLEVHKAANHEAVGAAVAWVRRAGWKPILQEYLPDAEEEFTSGVTVDTAGKRVMSSISMRRTLKNGQTHRAFIDDFPRVKKAAESIALKLGVKGPLNVQTRMARGKPKTFEINPRFSASCPMRAAAGINEPDIVFRNWVMKEKVSVRSHQKLVCLRYLNEVYVPLSSYEKTVKDGRTKDSSSFVPDYF
jgi:carbamoyl-phosphate synthase large subunit